MSHLLEKIKDRLNADERFHFLGRGANEGMWATTERGRPINFINLKKPLAQKGYGAIEIVLFSSSEYGVEMKIRLYIPSYCEWDTVFEGFMENENDFDRIMVMIGLN